MVARPDVSDNLLRPKDIFDILGTGWPFRAVTILPYLAATLLPTTASELSRLAEPSIVAALGVAALSVTILGALVFVTGLVLPQRWRRSSGIVLAVLMAIGAARGIIVSIVVDQFDLEERSHLWSRIVLAALSLPSVLALISLVVSRIVISRQLTESAQVDIAGIERNRDQVLDDIRTSDERLLAEVDETLRPAINRVITDVNDGNINRATLADELDRLANDVVRPLSHTLATTRSDFTAIRAPIHRTFAAPGVPTVREQVSAGFVGLGVFLGSGTVLVDLVSFGPALLAAFVSGLGVYAVVRTITLLIGGRRWSYRRSALLIVAVYSIVWYPPHLLNTALLFPPDLVFNPWPVSVVATPVVGLMYLLIVRGAYTTRNQLVRLDNSRLNGALELSESRRRAWLRQRHLTHTLHSAIQSRIHAEARLVRGGSGKLSPDEKNRVNAMVSAVLSSVNDDPPVEIDAVKGIHDMAAFWSGMCAIDLDVSADVTDVISEDPEVAESIQVVALEIISNAIRHGDATMLSISIARDTPETIRITATNNGQPLRDDGRAGLGTALYDELAAEWRIDSREDGGVTVTAIIAARGNTLVG